jgi:multiple antibiotic resistance protein
MMNELGVSIPAFRIAGGLLLLYIAFDMVFELRRERKGRLTDEAAIADHVRNVAAFPLAIPLMAGPGTITATVLLADRAGGAWLALTSLMAIVALTMVVTLVTLVAAERIGSWLGATGAIVLTRMLGVVLAALAVQFVIDGALAALR